jgi:hypothetical protein
MPAAAPPDKPLLPLPPLLLLDGVPVHASSSLKGHAQRAATATDRRAT